MTTEVRTVGHQNLLRSDLPKQERLLAGVAEATRQLLAIADFDTAVNGALEAIATATEIDRIYIDQYHVDEVTGRETMTCPYEWTAPNVVKCSEIPGRFPMDLESFDHLIDLLKAGQPMQVLAQELSQSAQDLQALDEALSLLAVPIFVDGQMWGCVGFDDCTTKRIWSETEIAVLETAAASFAGALERRDNLAELQRRDALLKSVNAAAQCLVATGELEQTIPEALQILGNGTQQDRVYVFENVFPKGPDEVFWDIPYEWVNTGIPTSAEVMATEWPIAMASFPPIVNESFLIGQEVQFLTRDLQGKAQQINEKGQTLSLLAVPIKVSSQWWGVLGFDDCTNEREWSDAEIAVLETAAACIGSAIERDRTRKEREAAAQARAEELSQVNSILQTSLTNLASQTDLTDFLGHVTHLINQAAGAYSGYVFLQDTPTNTLELRLSVKKGQIRIGASATDPELFQHPFPADITPAYPDLCKTREIGLYGGYLYTDSDLMWPGTTEWHRRSGHKEAAAVALFAGDQPIGMLGLTFDQEVDLRDEDRDLIRALADQAALAIQLTNLAEETKQTALLQEREQAAQARGAELAKVNHVLKETIDTLVAEPELSRFLGLVLKAIAQQFNSPFLEFWSNWRTDEENITYLEQVVINGEVLTGEQLSGHHGINGLSVPPELIKADDLSQRTQYIEIEISPNNPFIEPFYDNIYSWCRDRSVELTGHAINFPIILGQQSLGAIAIFLPKERELSDETIKLGYALANQVALAMQLTQLAEETKQTALLQERETVAKARIAELAERDRILEATAAAVNVLLTDKDFAGEIKQALQLIGEAVGTDRVGIAQHLEDLTETSPGHWLVIHEWSIPEMTPVADLCYPEPMQGTYGGAEQLYAIHQRGESFSIKTEQMMEPFRSSMAFMNIQTLHAVPIILREQYWGTVVFGDCRQQRQRTVSELTALQTVADCIGNAIDRDRIRKAREAAERTALIERERAARAAELEAANQVLTTRDRWLETTATAANQLLTADISTSVNTALQTIGTNLESDRLGVMRHIPDATELGHFQILYEWDSAGTAAQIDDLELHQMPAKDFAEWTWHLMTGQPVGGPVEEQPEPFRNKMLSLGTQSTYAVPIFIETEFWGVMFMDYCRELRQLTSAELAVFKTVATCIGSAIYREQMRCDREQAERDTLLQHEREQAAQKRAAALEIYNRQLQQRDTLLNSVNAAAQSLVANEDLATALPTMLKILGEGTGQCRAYILRNSLDEQTGQLLFNLMLEWDAPQIPPKMEVGAHFPVPIDRFPDHLTAPLKAGRATQFLASELDGIKPEDRQPGQVLSLVGVPITVGGEWWGLLGLDDCVEERVWSDAEIAVLETAASAVGGAVERDRSRQARETAEKAVLAEREKAARERAVELAKTNEAIARSLTSLVASPELDQFLGAIIAEMARQLNACKVHLFLYDEPTHTLTQRVAVQDGHIYLGAGPNDPEMLSHPIPADIPPGWDAIINGERPITYDETLPYDEEIWWPETLVWHKAQGHKAITCIPMKAGDVPIGYIGFCFYDRTVLSDEQIEFMQALTNQAIVAIQLTRLADEAKQAAILQEQEKAARDRATELAKTNEAISQTLDALTTEPELDRFLGQILTQIIEQIGADDTHLFLYDAETHTLHSQLAVQNNTVYLGNAPGDPELFYTDIPADINAAWHLIINSDKPFTLDDDNPETTEFLWPTTQNWHDSQGHQSATCACMKIGNEPIGFIGFAFCDQTILSTEQLEFVQALTNQATLAIHLTRLAEQARTNALTDERNRLAREIHDTLAQAFTGISLQLEAAKNILVQQPETAKSYLDQARDLTRQGLSEARRSVHALRSQALESESLAKALQKNLTQMTLNTSLQTEFQIQGTPILLEEGLQLNLLRIGQEAITNVLRHAQAQTLTVTLTFMDQEVGLCVTDDGAGFEPQDLADITGFGLVGIRERTARYQGQVQITSNPGEGTTIEVKMPVQSNASSPSRKEDGRTGR